jgi:cytochrome o ubiquinol oxidase operon protein cyoD
MSEAHDEHGHHEPDVEAEGVHATIGGYLTGFVLAVILTAIPFWLVMGKVIASPGWTTTLILALGAVQIVVHMIYFLHMTPKSESGWSLMGLVFTTVLVVITLSGSLWIMFHLRDNMMPMPPGQTRSGS